jgi:hypothetical protein
MDLGTVAELTYDDGSEFYSPSSYSRLIRSSKTGKLYWIGNITADPPNGNLPRYPLVIAQVNETTPTPTLIKSTVTKIDDRQSDEPTTVALSNFNVYDDRETGALEMYMSRYGENYGSPTSADGYHFEMTLIVPEPSSLLLLSTGGAALAAAALVRRRRRLLPDTRFVTVGATYCC